jgi:hypothetical protein
MEQQNKGVKVQHIWEKMMQKVKRELLPYEVG